MKKIAFLMVCWCLAMGASAAMELAEPDILLIVPSRTNVSSDYFPLDMIAEDMNIQVDSVAPKLNAMVVNGLKENCQRFQSKSLIDGLLPMETIYQKIVLRKISTQCSTADLSMLTDEEFRMLLGSQRTNYLVVISGYFIQRVEKPFQTLFHTVSYTVYDSNRTKTLDGNAYFNTFDLQSQADLEAGNRKISRKMVQAILKKTKLVPTRNMADFH